MIDKIQLQRRRVWQWASVLLALVLLNGSVTFHNVWPTLGVHWPGELSVELALLLLLLALSNAWIGRTSPRVLALLSALVVLFALGRYCDVTAPALYGREVNLYWDVPRLVSVVEMFVRVASAWQLLGVIGGALLVLVLLYAVARWSLQQVDQALSEYRPARLGLGALGVLLAGCFLGQQIDGLPRLPRFSIPVSRTYDEQLTRILDAVSSSRTARTLPPSPPLHSDLAALSGSDVLLVFLESYGSVTYDNDGFERSLQPARERLAAALRDTGREIVSGFVTSPTFGGESVLAHLSLLSGIEVRDSTRYALLMTQKRPTLVSVFRQAGYHTIAVMPGMRQDWPEGEFYGFDDIYDSAKLDYRGPGFGWWHIPDQYAVAALDARELQVHPRKPLFVFFPTVSTHIPFNPIPPVQTDWQRMLTAQPYDAAPLARAFTQRPDWTDMGQSYVNSVSYFFDMLSSYLRERANDNFVLIVLGDHQPAANVSGEGAPWEVPVHIISRRPELLQALQAHGFRPGLTPVRPSSGPMNGLALWLLEAFDQPPSESAPQLPRDLDRTADLGN
jgi:Sulfatase